ncbi:MAG: LysE family translocator [Roseitalea porphyridii]|jgi:threonine/homoserine/homoserine lactone efflux protein|uniref:LysE family translocator n=1 Tax=Roseitalea porphyridii TaxID=1852022 RepID=UPI0032EBDDFA
MSAEFLITSIIVVLLPGTGVLYTLAVGLGQGTRASVYAAFGCTLGIVPHILASIIGLAALLHASAVAFQVIKYLGVIYLFYMAWSVLREGGALDVGENRTAMSQRRIVTNGIALNVLNPKLSLFFLAFLPQFVPATATSPTALMVGLALVFMALTFVVFVCYGAFAAFARDRVMRRPAIVRWMKRSFAAAFAFLGVRLAFAER